jgi:hypothetical protein
MIPTLREIFVEPIRVIGEGYEATVASVQAPVLFGIGVVVLAAGVWLLLGYEASGGGSA